MKKKSKKLVFPTNLFFLKYHEYGCIDVSRPTKAKTRIFGSRSRARQFLRPRQLCFVGKNSIVKIQFIILLYSIDIKRFMSMYIPINYIQLQSLFWHSNKVSTPLDGYKLFY